jgi:hypothetical protein
MIITKHYRVLGLQSYYTAAFGKFKQKTAVQHKAKLTVEMTTWT